MNNWIIYILFFVIYLNAIHYLFIYVYSEQDVWWKNLLPYLTFYQSTVQYRTNFVCTMNLVLKFIPGGNYKVQSDMFSFTWKEDYPGDFIALASGVIAAVKLVLFPFVFYDNITEVISSE